MILPKTTNRLGKRQYLNQIVWVCATYSTMEVLQARDNCRFANSLTTSGQIIKLLSCAELKTNFFKTGTGIESLRYTYIKKEIKEVKALKKFFKISPKHICKQLLANLTCTHAHTHMSTYKGIQCMRHSQLQHYSAISGFLRKSIGC